MKTKFKMCLCHKNAFIMNVKLSLQPQIENFWGSSQILNIMGYIFFLEGANKMKQTTKLEYPISILPQMAGQ